MTVPFIVYCLLWNYTTWNVTWWDVVAGRSRESIRHFKDLFCLGEPTGRRMNDEGASIDDEMLQVWIIFEGHCPARDGPLDSGPSYTEYLIFRIFIYGISSYIPRYLCHESPWQKQNIITNISSLELGRRLFRKPIKDKTWQSVALTSTPAMSGGVRKTYTSLATWRSVRLQQDGVSNDPETFSCSRRYMNFRTYKRKSAK
jgi:hypothetical protein